MTRAVSGPMMGPWKPGLRVPGLARDEVHLWWWTSPGATSTSSNPAILTPAERERAGRLRRPGDGARWTATRARLRRILGAYLGQRPDRVVLKEEEGEKPGLYSSDSSLRFNLSHSGRGALLAVSREEVGVDLEEIGELPRLHDLIESTCSGPDRTSIRSSCGDGATRRFLLAWVRKEALLKGSGEGLGRDLRSLTVLAHGTGDSGSVSFSTRGERPEFEGWSLWNVTPQAGFVGAVAVATERPVFRCWTWEE